MLWINFQNEPIRYKTNGFEGDYGGVAEEILGRISEAIVGRYSKKISLKILKESPEGMPEKLVWTPFFRESLQDCLQTFFEIFNDMNY